MKENEVSNIKTPKKKNKTKYIIIGLIVIILLIIGAGVYIFTNDSINSLGDIKAIISPEKEHTILLEEFVTNLKPIDNKPAKSYLKAQLSIRYVGDKNVKLVESNIELIRDTVLTTFRGKTSEQVLNGEKVIELKDELRSEINKALDRKITKDKDKGIIKDVYFVNIVVQ